MPEHIRVLYTVIELMAFDTPFGSLMREMAPSVRLKAPPATQSFIV